MFDTCTRLSESLFKLATVFIHLGTVAGLIVFSTGIIIIFNPLYPIVHFGLHHTADCAEKKVSASAERVRQGQVGGVTQGDMHMVAARLGCQSAMAGTGCANSCPGCMDRLRKCFSHLVGGSFLAGKAVLGL